ncbi:hypothetical protein FJ661_10740 [Pseudarthrobacter phenanthrenivorans]|uniref:hypothetical protein n=1 Tax=Pseudarthrobacter phenanthrenivorans TaxID=361575 RepID=UPI00112EF4AC|nr:hypothetical protein [Pseudarthrobacter phenanthrenivorans]TPV50466.1 hypothetical protein FJ661_10740 [Pseudarthrobacter phenanthrenivorans]
MDYGIVSRDVALVVVEFLKVLAWPGVILVALRMFRQQINGIFFRVKEAAFAGVSVSLREEAGELSEKVGKLPEKLKKGDEGSTASSQESEPDEIDSDEADVLNNAKAQIEFSWADLEDTSLNLHQRLFMGSGGSSNPYKRPNSVVHALADLHRNKMIDSETLSTFREAQNFKKHLVDNANNATFETYSQFLNTIDSLKHRVSSWDKGML